MVNFILRKFFKAVAENPFLIIEVNCANVALPRVNNSNSDGMYEQAFYPKNRGQWKQFSSFEPEPKRDATQGAPKVRSR
jgi:replication fork protection complex subunit Tof1/Swi1